MAKKIILLLVVLIGIWALLPPREKTTAPAADSAGDAEKPATTSGNKMVIKVAPKLFYFPGYKPMGVGKEVTGLDVVEKRYEALHPDVDIQYVKVPAAREWLVTQVAAGLAPDIVDVNVEEVWQDAHKGWYIPLDDFLTQPNRYAKPGEPGSNQWWDSMKYQGISRGVAGPDGKTYCVVYDMVETGIYYNKDIFAEVGINPPKDWSEFISNQQKLEKAGYIPMLCSSANIADWGVDLVFDQFYRDVLPGIDLRLEEPPRSMYLVGYLDWDEIAVLFKKGFFTKDDPRWMTLWRTLKEWRRYMGSGISPESTDFVKLFLNQKGAMIWEGSWRVHTLTNDPSVDFAWDVFYLPPITRQYNQYGGGHEMVVIGGPATQWVVTNSAIKDTNSSATSKRLQICIDFLHFLNTPESSRAIVNEVAVFLPNTVGVEPRPELKVFDDILKRRYSTTKWFFTFDMKFNEILLRMLELYLNDGISEEEFLGWMTRNIESGVANVTRRKTIDLSPLEKRYQELAPVRAKMEGLPSGAK